ncbi:putative gustatory receptor 59d [Drosophila nasuta]|uniref:putative gustatory receptor 59d n=1 Tax=Drosophila nasuta TaxID=42062 RepID=UPI00295E2A31|nr:putative gustatory receptor 59d [Drosophila nasuta]
MFDIVQSMLRISYYYSRFLGVLNFEIDSKNGHARITTQSTIYAAVINVVLICLFPLLTQSELLHIMWKHAGQLHEYLFLVVMGMRVGCVIATLFSRWLQRHRLIYLVHAQELRSVLSETCALGGERRKATFMIKCCTLADQLEAIARRQSELQKLVDLMTTIFGIQGICIASSSYISCIGSIYFTFSAIKRSAGMTCGLNVYMLSGIVIGVYLLDLGITIDNTFTVLDDHHELEQLLEEYSSFGIELDKRLETVFESFQLQLARHRLEIPILGLYNMDKTMAISMTNSIILNSIVLIQYELKYS